MTPRTARERYARSRPAISMPFTKVRPAETQTDDLQNTNERLRVVSSRITLLSTTQKQNALSTGTASA